jgi:hypothetical protein
LPYNAQIKAPVEPALSEHDQRLGIAYGAQPSDRIPAAQRMIGCHDFRYPQSQFRISLFAGRSLPQAASLLRKAYSRLGYVNEEYQASADVAPGATASLHAVHRDTTLGTLSVNLDGKDGLRAEALYPLEVAALRRRGALCEFTELALDTELAGREVLCSLFYMAYVFAHAVQGAKHLLIEVNPRHECFYARMLGFRRIGEERICRRVGAPAVLLHLDFEFTHEQIKRARGGLTVAGTTLYRYAASLSDECALVRRMSEAML